MDELITIGELAARTRLSRKALRLYGDRGLLVPARLEGAGQVRRYGVEQIQRARLIGLMRSMGMPLARIAEVLELDGHAASQSVAAYWAQMEDQHTARRTLATHLQQVLDEATDSLGTPAQRDVAAQWVVSVRTHVDADGLSAFLDGATQELFAHLTAARARIAGHVFALYHGVISQDGDGPVEVCVPTDDPVEQTDRIRVRIEPAHREAYLKVTGQQRSYAVMEALHDTVAAWIDQRGLRLAGPAREVYHPNFTAGDDTEHVMDIAYPFHPPTGTVPDSSGGDDGPVVLS
ncbi:MerR family transcriptional regulator [Streptomyces sp. HUAS TT20]|uniref:MerR family transcriptional regulator n=1 Tax=Streptomyces sp. HUAS TT20 TaxID=3447509 RepID=UPI0021D82EFB|nr:MerR family transcriptional regulator [Streptomyces sp. HUAS 15-9]UXY32222.1 MerR family transcriptional regulator [Streptomyces sp. HUAS 15-9]